MNRILHIVSGRSSAATLKQLLNATNLCDEVISWNDCFMYGHLPTDFSQQELQERANYLAHIPFYIEERYMYDDFVVFVRKDYSLYDQIVVWHGRGVTEQLMLYMTCALIDRPLSQADITVLYKLEKFDHIDFQLALACCSTEDMKLVYDEITPIPDKQKRAFNMLWDKWKYTTALRLNREDGSIFEAGEDYFDALILSYCNHEYTNATRVIASVIGYSEQNIGDGFLMERMIKLIAEGELMACNNERYFEVAEKLDIMYKNQVVLNGVDLSWLGGYDVKLP